MKSIVVLSVMVLCVLQVASAANSLNTWRTAIAKKKLTVQSTINTLVRHQKDLAYNLNNKLHSEKISSMENVNSITNPTLKNIEDAVKVATENGKSASHCYDAGKSRLRELSLKAFSDLGQCSNDASATVKPSQDNIEATIQLGNNIISELDSIMLSCYSSNMLTMDSCIAGKMLAINGPAQSFQINADSVKSSSNAASSTAVNSARNCNQGITGTLRQRALDVQVEANSCIKSL